MLNLKKIATIWGVMALGALLLPLLIAYAADVGALSPGGSTTPAQPIAGMDSTSTRRVILVDTSGRAITVARNTSSITAITPTGVLVSSMAGGSIVHAANAADCGVTVCVVGVNAVTCGQSSAVTTGATAVGLVIKGSTVAGDGTGGCIAFNDYGGLVQCVAAVADTRVGVQATACP